MESTRSKPRPASRKRILTSAVYSAAKNHAKTTSTEIWCTQIDYQVHKNSVWGRNWKRQFQKKLRLPLGGLVGFRCLCFLGAISDVSLVQSRAPVCSSDVGQTSGCWTSSDFGGAGERAALEGVRGRLGFQAGAGVSLATVAVASRGVAATAMGWDCERGSGGVWGWD